MCKVRLFCNLHTSLSPSGPFWERSFLCIFYVINETTWKLRRFFSQFLKMYSSVFGLLSPSIISKPVFTVTLDPLEGMSTLMHAWLRKLLWWGNGWQQPHYRLHVNHNKLCENQWEYCKLFSFAYVVCPTTSLLLSSATKLNTQNLPWDYQSSPTQNDSKQLRLHFMKIGLSFLSYAYWKLSSVTK